MSLQNLEKGSYQRFVHRGGVMLDGVRYESSALDCHDGEIVRLVLSDDGGQVSVFVNDVLVCEARRFISSNNESPRPCQERGKRERVYHERARQLRNDVQ